MFKSIIRLALCAVFATGSLTARGNAAPDISGQYWFDGSGEWHQFTPGSFEITTDGLSEGFHTLHAFIDDGTDVSATHTSWFLKQTRKLHEGDPLTYFIYIDGQLARKDNVPVGTDGVIGINLDMNAVDLGVHILGLLMTDEEGNSLGYRDGVFMRVPTDMQRATLNAYYFLDGEYKGALDVDGSNPIVHLDIDASALPSGIHSVTAYLASPLGMATTVKSAWFVKIPNGGEGVKQYAYWLNDNEETLTTVNLPEVCSTYNIISLIDVPEQPFRSASHTFATEKGIPVLYACNDFKIRFVDPDGRVTTSSRTYTDVRVKYEPKEVIQLGDDVNIATGQIPSNEVKLYRFEAEIGDSVNVRVDRGAMLEVYSPTAETIIKAVGADATVNRTFTAKENGTYYVAVHDVTGGVTANMSFQRIGRFAMLHSTLASAANTGYAGFTVTGNGFDSLKSLMLVSDSGNEIELDRYEVMDNNTLCVLADLDELELPNGTYSLRGIFDDTEKCMDVTADMAKCFDLVDPREGKIAVEIEAPHIAGTPYLTYVHVTNTSNIGCWGVPVNIAIERTDRDCTFELMDVGYDVDNIDGEEPETYYYTDNLLGTGREGVLMPMLIPYLAPGETYTMTLGLTTDAHQIVPMYAWAGEAWSEEARKALADDDIDLDEEDDTNIFTLRDVAREIYLSDDEMPDTESPFSALRSSGAKRTAKIAYYNATRVALSGFGIRTAPVGSIVGCGYPSGFGFFPKYATYSLFGYKTILPPFTGKLSFVWKNGTHGSKSSKTVTTAKTVTSGGLSNLNMGGTLLGGLNGGNKAASTSPLPNPTPVDCYQSGDPNDMTGYVSPSGSNHIGREVKTVTYTIEFENDPEIANASASTIKVTSRISPEWFDLSTLKAKSLRIGDKEIELPDVHHFVRTLDMRTGIFAIAELTFDFDDLTGMAEWKLRSLDPLTLDDIKYMDYGILPVNDDSGRGTGYLTFSVDLRPGIADNTTIESSAVIVFDNNPPIPTPVWKNVTDFSTPSARIVSQTPGDGTTVDFTVEGTDTGSGIWTYDLYMRPANSSKWTAVKTSIESDSFSYTAPEGWEGATFAVLATDRAGNRQSEAALYVICGDADGNGAIDANDVVALRNYYLNENATINLLNADVNNDGVTDAQDATAIINLYLDNTVKKSMKRVKIK